MAHAIKINRGELRKAKRAGHLAIPYEQLTGLKVKILGSTRGKNPMPLAGKRVEIIAASRDAHGLTMVSVKFKNVSGNAWCYAHVPMSQISFGPKEAGGNAKEYYNPYDVATRTVSSESATTLPQGMMTPEIVAPITPAAPVASAAIDACSKRLRIAMLALENTRQRLNQFNLSDYTRAKETQTYMRDLARAVACVNQRDQAERTAVLQREPFRLMPFVPTPDHVRPVAKRGKHAPQLHPIWEAYAMCRHAERQAKADAERARLATLRGTWNALNKAEKEKQAKQDELRQSTMVAHRTDARQQYINRKPAPRNSLKVVVEMPAAGLRPRQTQRWALK